MILTLIAWYIKELRQLSVPIHHSSENAAKNSTSLLLKSEVVDNLSDSSIVVSNINNNINKDSGTMTVNTGQLIVNTPTINQANFVTVIFTYMTLLERKTSSISKLTVLI